MTLTSKEYSEAIESAAMSGVEGGRTYDSLLLRAAVKSGAERILTFNVRHFQALADEKIRKRISAP